MIIDHSYVYWAAHYAASSPWGNDLVCGMQRIQLGRLTAFNQSPPDILVIHLGGNDLPQSPGKAVILDSLRDLKRLNERYPAMQIEPMADGWSTIIP